MVIRGARDTDAIRACSVMRRSIAELCGSDHHNNPAILARWLANKTPENFTAWIAEKDNRMFVAVENDAVLAVGAVRTNGEVTLNYVSPDARFRGVSRAMLARLEATAQAFGNDESRLVSTETARRFYLSAGYRQVGAPEGKFGTTSSYPMVKRFAAGDERP
ncbi:MAG: GNAT family N-acetyltransferase [Proteobacteria bacterium]|nr:GNAT family N-acetyltransferase [Pseudomonadota bacterium]